MSQNAVVVDFGAPFVVSVAVVVIVAAVVDVDSAVPSVMNALLLLLVLLLIRIINYCIENIAFRCTDFRILSVIARTNNLKALHHCLSFLPV